MSKYLHFHRASFGKEEERELIAALRSGWITLGPRCEKFERAMSRYLGVKHALATNSCTAALHLALLVAGVGKGDEVITSSLTFASTVNVIEHCGAKPVFADIRLDNLNIDETRLAGLVNRRTKAIVPVHFAGRPCDMRAICALARRKKLMVISDCAHALETEYGGKKVSAWGDAAAFSFYATKNITTGEGGMLVTRHKRLAEQAGVLRLHGLSRDAWKRYHRGGSPHYAVVSPGYKYNMGDLQAVLGLAQLKKVTSFWRQRAAHKLLYDKLLRGKRGIQLLSDSGGAKDAHHLYVLMLRVEELGLTRDKVVEGMLRRRIGVGIHFRPVHLEPYYRRKYGYSPGDLPNTEYAGERILSLPFYPSLSARDVERIVRELLAESGAVK